MTFWFHLSSTTVCSWHLELIYMKGWRVWYMTAWTGGDSTAIISAAWGWFKCQRPADPAVPSSSLDRKAPLRYTTTITGSSAGNLTDEVESSFQKYLMAGCTCFLLLIFEIDYVLGCTNTKEESSIRGKSWYKTRYTDSQLWFIYYLINRVNTWPHCMAQHSYTVQTLWLDLKGQNNKSRMQL